MHAEWPIGLELEGAYHDLGAFLERVSKFNRIINVGNIKIKRRTRSRPALGRLTAECTATTFVLIDAKPAPACPGRLPEQVTLVTRSPCSLAVNTPPRRRGGICASPTNQPADIRCGAGGADDGCPAQSAAAEKKSDSVEPQGFTYNADGRRDPFVSLLRRGSTTNEAGKRVAGLAGLGTAEVSLRHAQEPGQLRRHPSGRLDNKTYIVRAGDKLADGSIRSITADAMVILQQVNDPLSIAKEHEVRKLLRQTEEVK